MLREVIAATLIMATATASAPYAGGQRIRGARGHGGPRIGAALRHLDLSDSQRDSIRQLMERQREAMEPLRDQFGTKMKEYRSLREANDPRAESVKTELTAMKEQFQSRRGALRSEIGKILTPEQRQKLEEWKWKRPGPRGRNRE